MTDRETLLAMFERAGIKPSRRHKIQTNELIIDSGEDGYSGFFAVFTFTEEEALESVGAWE